jgi:protein-S-isoprenylcysteine O-methyltransferase Ste14
VASVFITVSGALLFLWSGRVLGQYMRVEIVVSEKHELVTGGPYSRIRHPTYTGGLMIDLGTALFFLNIILVVSFVARVAMAYKRAVLEEALLASDEGFGKRYQEYMGRTGRFLPQLGSSQRIQRSS